MAAVVATERACDTKNLAVLEASPGCPKCAKNFNHMGIRRLTARTMELACAMTSGAKVRKTRNGRNKKYLERICSCVELSKQMPYGPGVATTMAFRDSQC